MIQKHCWECGAALIEKPLEGEGIVPFCPVCGEYRFPMYNTAVSMIVTDEKTGRILLIQQYGKQRNILVAGYVNRGEAAEKTVAREVKEEVGLDVCDIHFNTSQFFEPSNTLMLNFSCVATTQDLSHMTDEVDKAKWFSFADAREAIAPNSLAQKFLLTFLEKHVVNQRC